MGFVICATCIICTCILCATCIITTRIICEKPEAKHEVTEEELQKAYEDLERDSDFADFTRIIKEIQEDF